LTEEQHTETKKLLCRFAFLDGWYYQLLVTREL
jgi:hypothetical protein